MNGHEAVEALTTRRVFARLDPAGAVALRGPDARRFCNGMFTNNVRDLAPGAVQRTAILDDRGRVLGLLRLACTAPDAFVAFPDGGARAELETRFARFLVFDDVEVSALSLPVGYHVAGPTAAEALAAADVRTGDGIVLLGDGFVLPADRFGVPGFDVWGRPPPEPPLSEALATVLRVRAGSVVWPDDVGEKRLVHELGLRDAVLHFAKGCYIGQETVNRVDVIGGVKRRLTGLIFPDGATVAPGQPIEAGGETVGAVASVARVGAAALALAVVRIPADAPGTAVTAGGAAGTTAAFPLPVPA